ncbi:hypothetical protein LCGC14_1563840 [marine sediment metagenome]|uniref:Glycosyl transferase family 28 C-terminal domain-containing protein n=1 Tax=marine sediment metagenome TaxID=412755 RepID=A0A0F9LMB3_9ZZZZ
MPRINIVADGDGEYGMGHIVRQRRLAEVLQQRGAEVCFYLEPHQKRCRKLVSDFVIKTPDDISASEVLIVDRMPDNNSNLGDLRQFCDTFIVFVSSGQFVTLETYWLADYVVWQNMHNTEHNSMPDFLRPKAREGKDWIILSPSLRNPELAEHRYGIATYFGGGVDRDAILSSGPEDVFWLGRDGDLEYNHTPWSYDVGATLLASRAFLGTMGMVAYEAISAGLRPLLVSRAEDHRRTAGLLQGMELAYDLGLAEEWGDDKTARMREILDNGRTHLSGPYLRPDGWGAWRIADLILNGGKLI